MELQDVHPNETVTLESDPTFRGYVVGVLDLAVPGPAQLLLVIADPGATGKHQGSHKPFPMADCRPAPERRGK